MADDVILGFFKTDKREEIAEEAYAEVASNIAPMFPIHSPYKNQLLPSPNRLCLITFILINGQCYVK